MLSPLSAALILALAASSVSATLPRLGGVNLAGLEFGISTDGSSGNHQAPPLSQIAHFSGKGANLFRIPFGWQYLTPQVGGSADATYLALIDSYVQAALSASSGTYVLLDLHNYARWNGAVVGSGGPTDAQFASLWAILAKKYASESRVIYGLMKEPHDMPSVSNWVTSSQSAVSAIRSAGAVGTILLTGTEWSHIPNLIDNAGPALIAGVKDPLNKLAFDVHAYLDSDGSGTQGSCTTDNVELMTKLSTWLKSVKMQAILSETGVPNNADCIAKYKAQLAYVASVPEQIAGFAAWSAGSFDPNYLLSITPSGDVDNAVATGAVIPNFPGSSPTKGVNLGVQTSTSIPVRASSAPASTSSVPAPIASTHASVASTLASVATVASASVAAPVAVPSAILSSSLTIAVASTSAKPSLVVPSAAATSAKAVSSIAPRFSTVIRSASSSFSAAPIVKTSAVVAAPSAATSSAAPSPSALGGLAAPAVVANADGSFTVGSRTDFKNQADAAGNSCDQQKNLCADKANQSGSTFSVNDCDAQANQCRSAIIYKRSHINRARHH